jgi:O-antigen/teichoic acid export membrane protein
MPDESRPETAPTSAGIARGEIAEPPERTLAQSTVEGIRWIGAARAAAEMLAVLASVVLARYISPAEFGRAAAALGLVAAAEAFVSQAFGTAIVQTSALTNATIRAAFTLSLATGAFLVLLLLLLSEAAIAPLLGERTAEFVALGAPAVVAAAIGTVARALLLRQLAFRTLGLIEVGALLAGSTTAVVLATVFAVDGPALVVGFVASNTAATILALVFSPIAAPGRVNRDLAQPLLAFGLPSGGSALLATSFKSIDYLVLSSRLPAAAVGYYWRAFSLGVEYQQKLGLVMQRIAFPVFSRAGSLTELRRLRLRAMATYAAVIFPLLGTLVAVAPTFVPWLFGETWEPAVVPTQILSGAGMVTALIAGTPAFMLALGRPKPLLAYNILAVVGLALVAYASAPLGVDGVAACILAFYVVLLLLNHGWLLHSVGGIELPDLIREPAPPLAACVPLVLADLASIELCERAGLPDLVVLLMACSVGVVVYALALRVLFPRTWRTHRTTFARVVGLR